MAHGAALRFCAAAALTVDDVAARHQQVVGRLRAAEFAEPIAFHLGEPLLYLRGHRRWWRRRRRRRGCRCVVKKSKFIWMSLSFDLIDYTWCFLTHRRYFSARSRFLSVFSRYISTVFCHRLLKSTTAYNFCERFNRVNPWQLSHASPGEKFIFRPHTKSYFKFNFLGEKIRTHFFTTYLRQLKPLFNCSLQPRLQPLLH